MTTEKQEEILSYAEAGGKSPLQRMTLSDRMLKTANSAAKKTITNRLQSEYASLKNGVELMAAANAPVRALLEKDSRAVAAHGKLNELFHAERQLRMEAFRKGQTPILKFELQMNPGFDVMVPPYDLEWGMGASSADKDKGEFKALIVNGYSAAAVGVVLSSPVRAAVRFSPIVPFSYYWMNWPFSGPASSQGGVGVLAYANKDTQPFIDKRAVLWHDWRDYPMPIARDDGGDFFATTPPLGDILLQVEPGNTYQMWMWCWGMGHSVSDADRASTTLSEIRCRMPFVVVDAGPPLPPVR
jgi:hypothetical protein